MNKKPITKEDVEKYDLLGVDQGVGPIIPKYIENYPIPELTNDFGRDDLNQLKDTVNELIRQANR